MLAFAPTSSFATAKPSLATSFTSAPVCHRRAATHTAPTMILRTSLRKPVGSSSAFVGMASGFGGAAAILSKADTYMAQSILMQYYKVANPAGVYGVQCTEGGSKHMADFSRIRALNARFRARQASKAQAYARLFENRKMAIVSSHECHHEETQFSQYANVAASYNVSRAEALGSCSRYATPETVEEAALLRFMDIQQTTAANPSGVYNVACNEGAAKFQAEDCRVAALNAAYRNGQKSAGKLLQEKYDQRKKGYAATHGCNYEEGLVNNYPALGATFRPKTYGY
ncbi:Gamma 31 kDa subunit of phycoerythrin [Chondrus crispus]|uniref:Gamma 31 kDa subunit of phycoerythrin n=1 Tax=Chondrus crispus TaxID=2769 RepID=R7QDA3_CHOCR|nr:Gamma 31 kDa subunit of phycoerythrin [Chondrus crispus]CDF35425.1 Gamma 31 kDa subunit of phycoerythrin [Chondrus crispus]|eukprot:XP_005715244.1 Gamma 31 kDa subunit of phycoerythrin [Chondrus crispus]